MTSASLRATSAIALAVALCGCPALLSDDWTIGSSEGGVPPEGLDGTTGAPTRDAEGQSDTSIGSADAEGSGPDAQGSSPDAQGSGPDAQGTPDAGGHGGDAGQTGTDASVHADAGADAGDAGYVCGVGTCGGCCDSHGECVGGQSATTCGTNGGACTNCQASSLACSAAGTCVTDAGTPPTSCAVSSCTNGCIPFYQTTCCKSDFTCGCEVLNTSACK